MTFQFPMISLMTAMVCDVALFPRHRRAFSSFTDCFAQVMGLTWLFVSPNSNCSPGRY